MSDDRPAVMVPARIGISEYRRAILQVRPVSEELRRAAREALESMERRKDEDVDEWAARLAADAASWND